MNKSSDPGANAPAQSAAQQYHADGFLIMREVFNGAEVAEMGAKAARAFQRQDLIDQDNIRCRWQNCASTGEWRFDCFDPIIDLTPIFARVARVVDDFGNVFLRGERVALNIHEWQSLSQSCAASQFLFLPPEKGAEG
jgi:hypothetical protein